MEIYRYFRRVENKSWYQRNKKWFLPTVLGGPIILVGGFICIILLVVTGSMKSSDAYKMSMNEIRNSKKCQKLLGDNIEDGFFIRGNINTTTTGGNANLYIPLSGELGEGTAYSRCNREWFKWEIEELQVRVSNEVIILK